MDSIEPIMRAKGEGMESTIAGIIFVFFGVLGFAAGLLNWQAVLEPSRNYSFIRALGPLGMRVFYVILGIFVWGVGVAFLSGVLRFGANR